MADQGFAKREGQGVEVAGGLGRILHQDLRRHIGRTSQGNPNGGQIVLALGGFCGPKVEDFGEVGIAVDLAEHDVLRLEVAVDDVFAVSEF